MSTIRKRVWMVFAILCLVLPSGRAIAGQRTGSGGDAVVCRTENSQIISAETLDYFEARYLRGLRLALSGKTYLEMIRGVLDRLERVDPDRAARYWQAALSFESQTQFVSDLPLTDIQDSYEGLLNLPEGCKLEQAAIRRNWAYEFETRFLIDRELWDRMDETSRAGLVLHEIIYLEPVLQNDFGDGAGSGGYIPQEDSRATRSFNAMISSELINSISLPEYVRALNRFGFRPLRQVRLSNPDLVLNHLEELKESQKAPRRAYMGILADTFSVEASGSLIEVEAGGWVWFDESLVISEVSLGMNSMNFPQGTISAVTSLAFDPEGRFSGYHLGLNSRGNLKFAAGNLGLGPSHLLALDSQGFCVRADTVSTFGMPTPMELVSSSGKMKVSSVECKNHEIDRVQLAGEAKLAFNGAKLILRDDMLFFHPNGMIRRAGAKSGSVVWVNGKKRTLSKDSAVTFDMNGSLLTAE